MNPALIVALIAAALSGLSAAVGAMVLSMMGQFDGRLGRIEGHLFDESHRRVAR